MRSIRNCPVCVVGGAGFLGSHLVDHLIEDRGCDVLVLDNLVSGRLEFVHSRAQFEHADITGSESHLLKMFRSFCARFVFNYAAQPYVPVSFERPMHVFDINAFGALKVINAAWESGCEGILQVSSAELYGDQSGHIDEAAPVRPHSSYGAAKAAIDAMVQVRWREAQVPVIALRQFNCVGERDETHPYVIPEIMYQIHENGPRLRLGNNSHRDFMYAGDAVRVAARLLEKGQFGEVYNSGSEESVAIYDLARMIGRLMGHESVEIATDTARIRPWEIWSLMSCNDKLRAAIGPYDPVTLSVSLERTLRYFESVGWRKLW